jgi:hypothetical protein
MRGSHELVPASTVAIDWRVVHQCLHFSDPPSTLATHPLMARLDDRAGLVVLDAGRLEESSKAEG